MRNKRITTEWNNLLNYREMNKKLKVVLKVLQNVEKRYPETKEFENSMSKICGREHT